MKAVKYERMTITNMVYVSHVYQRDIMRWARFYELRDVDGLGEIADRADLLIAARREARKQR